MLGSSTPIRVCNSSPYPGRLLVCGKAEAGVASQGQWNTGGLGKTLVGSVLNGQVIRFQGCHRRGRSIGAESSARSAVGRFIQGLDVGDQDLHWPPWARVRLSGRLLGLFRRAVGRMALRSLLVGLPEKQPGRRASR